jgi:hypothetical protein
MQSGSIHGLMFHTKLTSEFIMQVIGCFFGSERILLVGSKDRSSMLETNFVTRRMAEFLVVRNRFPLNPDTLKGFVCSEGLRNLPLTMEFGRNILSAKSRGVKRRINGKLCLPLNLPHVVVVENFHLVPHTEETVTEVINMLREWAKAIPFIIVTFLHVELLHWYRNDYGIALVQI